MAGTTYIEIQTADASGQVFFGGPLDGTSTGTLAGRGATLTQTPYNTTGPTGPTGMNGTNGAPGATGPSGMNGADGAAGAMGATGAMGAAGGQGSIGATGPAGPTGPQGVPGPAGTNGSAASVGIESVTAAQNPDGTTVYQYTGGSYFDGKSYSAVTDTRDANGSLTTEVRDRNDGGHGVSVYQQGQTVASSYYDTFQNGGVPDTTFVFNPGYGRDVVNLFRAAGDDHDTLSFLGSDFGSTPAAQLASLLNHSQENAAGNLVITDPTTKDKLVITGLSRDTLVQNERDIVFR